MTNNVHPLPVERGKWLEEPRVIRLFIGNLLLLNPEDIALFEKISEFKESRITNILNEEYIANNREKAEYYTISDPEELKLVKNTFYQYPNADALINSLYCQRKYHYILQYSTQDRKDSNETYSKTVRDSIEIECLKKGLILETEPSSDGKVMFVKIFVPFWTSLCQAEKMKLKMKLKLNFKEPHNEQNILQYAYSTVDEFFFNNVDMNLVTDFITVKDLEKFEGGDRTPENIINLIDNFFPTNRKQLIAFEILSSVKVIVKKNKDVKVEYNIRRAVRRKFLTAAFVPHDGSHRSKIAHPNMRTVLYKEWCVSFFRKQPYNKIREYFGEKIAMYFAWFGFYTFWVGFSGIVGLAVFVYGISYALTTCSSTDYSCIMVNTFDNNLTVPFAFFISVWSTLFLEFWKRRNAVLAHNWDVEDFEKQEITREEWKPTKTRRSIISGKLEPHYPENIRLLKMVSSGLFVLIAVSISLCSVVGIIVVRAYLSSADVNSAVKLVIPALSNVIIIMLLQTLYSGMVVKLTNWENHRTQTQYEDSLVAKTFAFDFVNNYSSLFYMAFFKGPFGAAIFGQPSWNDSCVSNGGNSSCMSDLFVQLAIIFTVQQLVAQVQEMLIPWIDKRSKVKQAEKEDKDFKSTYADYYKELYKLGPKDLEVNKELLRPPQWVKDSKMDDYASVRDDYKTLIIQFGFITMFAVAFPLAPFLAHIHNLIGIRVDAVKLIREFKKPIPYLAQDIGVWENFLSIMSIISVVTNGFLIGLFSSYVKLNYVIPSLPSSERSVPSAIFAGQLVVIIVFEFVVLSIKTIAMFLIPDVPAAVKIADDRRDYRLKKLADPSYDEGYEDDPNLNHVDVN